VDFGRTADDYDRYRTEFPPELFAALADLRVGLPGQRVVDLGTGTGILARGFAAAGCTVTGLDISPELLERARLREPGAPITYQVAPAEDTGLPGGSWDVVSAAQCWHWFDRPRVAEEVRRLLVPGGALAICYRDYVSVPGNVCAASEELIVAHHPGWPLSGVAWSHPEWVAELGQAGFDDVSMVDFELDVRTTPSWPTCCVSGSRRNHSWCRTGSGPSWPGWAERPKRESGIPRRGQSNTSERYLLCSRCTASSHASPSASVAPVAAQYIRTHVSCTAGAIRWPSPHT
jgi:SAM-dependent methyltransferase